MAEQESVYLWSTTALTNGAIDPAINFAEGQLPGTVNNSTRATMAALARYIKDTNGSLTTAGSANAYTLTINGRQTPLATGHILKFKASFSSTGAATLAVTNADAVALGAKAIRGPGDVALVGGQMISGGVYIVRYDTAANSAAGAWILLNPASVAISGTPTAGQVTQWFDATTVQGVNFSAFMTAGTGIAITGTLGSTVSIASNASFSATLGGSNQTGIVGGATTKITFNTKVYDIGTLFSTANNRWTPPAGTVQLSAGMLISGTWTSANPSSIYIYKNGNPLFQSVVSSSTNQGNGTISVSDRANGTDYYEVFLNQATSSGTVTVNGGTAPTFTYFTGHWICP